MIRAALALLLVAHVAALESWGLPDLRQDDKQAHAAVGFGIGAVTAVTCERFAPRWRPWQRVVAGLATSALVGAAKEVADAHSRNHASDPRDAIATAAGGVAGALSVELIWHF